MQYSRFLFVIFLLALFPIFHSQSKVEMSGANQAFLPLLQVPAQPSGRVVGNGSAESCTSAALNAAIQLGGEITFNCGSQPVNIQLSAPIELNRAATIDGANSITLDGQWQTAILVATDSPAITLTDLRLANGISNESGGALAIEGETEVWITNVTFENNVSHAESTSCDGGGALYFGAGTSVNIYDSTFHNNRAQNGGAIMSFGQSLGIYNSYFSSNQATQTAQRDLTIDDMLNGRSTGGVCAGGGAVYFGGDDFTSHSNVFRTNQTNQHGGALFLAAQNGSVFDIWRNIFDDNVARVDGTWSGTGGALWIGERIADQWDFDITVRQSAITRNFAQFQGGGALVRIPATFQNVTIAENRAYNDSVDQDWQRGGGGGVRVDQSAAVTLRHVTLANNHAGHSGGGLMGADVRLQNSLVAGNSADFHAQNCAQPVIDQGGNVQWGDSAECHANIPNADPKLAPLVVNGGFSETMGLQTESSALDVAVLANCTTHDQRNWSRPQGNGCDAGAYEGTGNYTPPTATPETPTPTATTPTPIVTTPPPSVTPPTVTPTTLTATPTATTTPPTVTPPPDTPTPTPIVPPGDNIVGNGSAASCTEYEFASAIISGGSVTFDCGAQPHTIRLTRRHIFTRNIDINGNNKITLDGQSISALLAAESDLTVAIRNITLRNGSTVESGAALRVGERTQLTIDNVIFENNLSRAIARDCDGGGAIFADAGSVLTVTDSEFADNRANNGGAINARRSGLIVEDSRFTNNQALSSEQFGGDEDCGGGAIFLDGVRTFGGDQVTIARSDFVGNRAVNGGGALLLFAYSNEKRLIDEVLFEDNVALAISDVPISGMGGAIMLDEDTPQNGDTSTVQKSAFINNHADTQGGGLWTNRPMTLENTTWYGNVAYNDAITNPTSWRRGSGGAIAVTNSKSVVVWNNTIVGNSAGLNGGGIYGEGNQFANTIIANNSAMPDNATGNNCSHTVNDLGNSLHYVINGGASQSGCGTLSLFATPQLASLANNGGRTPTMMLNSGSPALNGGNNENCMLVDQRGVSRPQNGTCDIGAVEVE